MHSITPFLWFDDQAEEAAHFYVEVFPDSRINSVTRYPEGSPGPAGTVMTVDFSLDGTRFTALGDGGEPGQCGWLKDRYGLSWQIVPPALIEMLGDPDPARASRVTQAMLPMGKLDLAALRAAFEG